MCYDAIAQPVSVLVPLIKEALADAEDAAEKELDCHCEKSPATTGLKFFDLET
jgi:hypothetical protein